MLRAVCEHQNNGEHNATRLFDDFWSWKSNVWRGFYKQVHHSVSNSWTQIKMKPRGKQTSRYKASLFCWGDGTSILDEIWLQGKRTNVILHYFSALFWILPASVSSNHVLVWNNLLTNEGRLHFEQQGKPLDLLHLLSRQNNIYIVMLLMFSPSVKQ